MRYQRFSKRQNLTLTWWNRPRFKDYDGIIADGSIRSGKTLSMALGFVLWSMARFDGEVFGICGKTIGALRRNVIAHLPTWLEGIVSITENLGNNRVTIRYGTHTNTYYLFGGKDESSAALIQGITLAGVYFDEVALMPRSFVEQAMARCSVEGSKYWFNCNPENPSHWFYTDWIQKARERNVLYLHFTMDDNLSLSEDIKRRYEGMYTGVFYRRYILGLWVKAEGLVYPMFDENSYVIDYQQRLIDKGQARINPRHRYYVSVDYGTVNPFSAGLYDYNPVDHTSVRFRSIYYDGHSEKRVDNEAYYTMLEELIGDYPIQYIVIDPSAAAMVATITAHGRFIVMTAQNDVLNGIQKVTEHMNAGRLLFDKDCSRDIINEFHAYSWDEKSTEDKVIKANDHAMDELRYYCYTVLEQEMAFFVQ